MATRDFSRPPPPAPTAPPKTPAVTVQRSASSRLAAAVAAANPEAALSRPMPLAPAHSAAPAAVSAPAPLRSVPPPPPPAPSWQVHAGPGQQVILMPGQMSFSTAHAQLRTLLGSCVSITVWHPARRIGGMCHFLLPQRQRRPGEPLDGRYGDEAMQVMVEKLVRAGTKPSEYVAHLYGGADTMPEGNGLKFNVGERNIERGWTLIDHYGFQLDGVDVGEDVPRMVAIDLGTGQVDIRRGAGKAPVHPELAQRAPSR